MYSTDIYHTINIALSSEAIIGSNINDEQVAIMNNLSTLLSGNHYINDFNVIKVNDLISYVSIL